MKSVKLFAVVIALLGAMVGTMPAHGQAGTGIAVSIPFDFVVGNSLLKAGSYKVEILQAGVLDFWNLESRDNHFALVNGNRSQNSKGDGYLVFGRYGNEAFLDKVALSADETYDLTPGSREKQFIATMGSGEKDAVVVQPVL